MNKWELKPVVKDDFVKQNPEYDKIILQLLFNRRITENTAIESFFNPDKARLSDPFLFNHMQSAVDLTVKHIKQGDAIAVFGDYDADGVTASAVLIEILSIFKAKTKIYIPDRASEGYGLNKKAIDELSQAGVKLIITVDNGIRNKQEAAYASVLGIDMIITDHHEPPQNKNDWPECLVINPKSEEGCGYKHFAGVGVAFKFAQALIQFSKLDEALKNKLTEKVLDLVAVGTVADMVSLLGENRTLTSRGLKVINALKRAGIRELIAVAQINGGANKKINSSNIGWQISPRLNSAGRLDHANTAYELLITKNINEARAIAERLNAKNIERQKITEDIIAYCKKIVEEKMPDDLILIVYSPNIENESGVGWPEGVVGLAAGRLCDQYCKPALVLTKINGEIKGSGRSIKEFNIMTAIEQASSHLKKFGGHAAACGFTLKSRENLAEFANEMKRIAQDVLGDAELYPTIFIEAEICLHDISDELVESLEKFEPFGQDNPRPVFLSRNLRITDKVNMGQDSRHVKFRFGQIWAIAFCQAEKLQNFKIGEEVDVVYYLEFNEFNGRRSEQMKIIDMKKSRKSES